MIIARVRRRILAGRPRFVSPLNGSRAHRTREKRGSLGWRRESSRKASDEERCVTACNLALASSLAEITGSSFPRSTRSSPSSSFFLPFFLFVRFFLVLAKESFSTILRWSPLFSLLPFALQSYDFVFGDIIKPAAMSSSIHARIIVQRIGFLMFNCHTWITLSQRIWTPWYHL